ncbi:polyamine-transporting ATPase 13A3-like [Hydra vulgaris]|uniref:Cation-transporting ATPase n=1 Tax=Hydra vulgaris TaxID=6087 RepID=A0ABM4BGB8_HYDVU
MSNFNANDQQSIYNEIVVHAETEDEFTVHFYCKNWIFTVLFFVLGIFTAGIVFLIGYWYPTHRLMFTHNRCNIKEASSVRIKKPDRKQFFVSRINILFNERFNIEDFMDDYTEFEQYLMNQSNLRYFEFTFLRYIICEESDTIIPLKDAGNRWSFSDIRRCKNGIHVNSVINKLAMYDVNYINIPIRSYFLTILQLYLNPIYIFQLFSVILWYFEDYYLYATFIFIMTFMSLALNAYLTKLAVKKLHDIIPKAKEVQTLQPITTFFNKSFKVISKSTRELVPGDVLVIPVNGIELSCDVVLLSGRCVVNESSLTGESIPNIKTAIEDALEPECFYNVNLHKEHTIYNGTTIIQAQADGENQNILALVVRTGFYTLKGDLIRSIVYPTPIHFTFSSDVVKFLLCISVLAILSFIYTAFTFIKKGLSKSEIFIHALDLVTVVIPAALPLILSIGLMNASRRLNTKKIYCVDPNRINICGKVKLVLFDKTGTLTDDHVTVSGVIPVINGKAKSLKNEPTGLANTHLFKAMSTCHNLSIIDAKISGDPIDMYMFNFTKCKLHDSGLKELIKYGDVSLNFKPYIKAIVVFPDNNKSLSILKHFTFESALQRMTVVTINNNDEFIVYTKGSPEKILSMCIGSSIPSGIREEIAKYTRVGNRVLAVAHKTISEIDEWSSLNKIPRGEIESNLLLSGIIVFENVVKQGTHDTIKILSQANIKTAMVTGDDLLTASFVAREIDMITPDQDLVELSFLNGNEVYKKLKNHKKAIFLEEKLVNSTAEMKYSLRYDMSNIDDKPKFLLALTGESYEKIHNSMPNLLRKTLVSGAIFSRMSPYQKTILVKDFQKIGYGVCMCGDGANDCGALKAAHAGIALSYADASIAAPFTSKIFNISCVPNLIMEGRASLVTAFGTFKYMILYSMIMFFGIIVLYIVQSKFSNNQFIYLDLALSFPLVFAMTLSNANRKLAMKRPMGRLFHPIYIGGIILHVFLVIGIQLITFFCIKKMTWYFPSPSINSIQFNSMENASVAIVSFYMAIWLSLICLKGRPFLSPIYQNYVYGIICSTLIALTLYITIYPERSLLSILNLIEPPNAEYSVFLIGVALCHLVSAFLLERLLETKYSKIFADWLRKKKAPRNIYKHILKELKNQDWPPQEQIQL